MQFFFNCFQAIYYFAAFYHQTNTHNFYAAATTTWEAFWALGTSEA